MTSTQGKLRKSKDGKVIRGESCSERRPPYYYFSEAEDVDIILYRVRNTADLFQDCPNLRKVKVSLPCADRVYDVFRRCPKLEYLDMEVPDAGGVHTLMHQDLSDYQWDNSFNNLKCVRLFVNSVSTYKDRLPPRSRELRKFVCNTRQGQLFRAFCLKKSKDTAITILLETRNDDESYQVIVANEWMMDVDFTNRNFGTQAVAKYRFERYPELRAMMVHEFNQSGPKEYGDIRHLTGKRDMYTEFFDDMWNGHVVDGIGEGFHE